MILHLGIYDDRYSILSEFKPHEMDLKFLSEALRFSIHVLYGLYLLHKYSRLDGIWKLIDFNQFVLIEDSLKVSRTAGTELCWAPECPSGRRIFSTASDIYSFGGFWKGPSSFLQFE